jgi:chromosome partitioning protein
MKVIALYNIKGGVGKTASAVNLAYCAAKSGARTLLWDLDPQGASSFYFRIKPTIKGGLKPLMGSNDKLLQNIKATDYENLDLLPADLSLRHFELALNETKGSRKRLRKILEPFLDTYDFIFLDCPPNLTLLTENIIRAANVILCPVIPTTLSERTLSQLRQFLEEEQSSTRLLPFFSMAEKRKSLQTEIMDDLPHSAGPFLKTVIPYLSDVERMGIHREPVAVTKYASRAAKAYSELFAELNEALRE